jgi:hypothetical protein
VRPRNRLQLETHGATIIGANFMSDDHPTDRRLVQFAKADSQIQLDSIRQRADRIQRGQVDPVDLMPGRLFRDVETLLDLVGERAGAFRDT